MNHTSLLPQRGTFIVSLLLTSPAWAESPSVAAPELEQDTDPSDPAETPSESVAEAPEPPPLEGSESEPPAAGLFAPSDVPADDVVESPPTDAPPAAPPPAGNSSGGFLDFNFYPYLSDVKTDSVFTLNAFAKLKHGFSYFSLTNIANQADENPFHDTNGYYTEQNLRWTPEQVKVPVDLTIQYNMRGGPDNDRLRFGFRWRLEGTPVIDAAFKAIHLSYSINFHLLQLDHEDGFVWQMEHVGRIDTPYLDRRLYLAGFADHTFNQDFPDVPRNPAVIEIQAGVRLVEEFYAIAEYRINQYRVGDVTNLGAGVQYVAKW